MSAWDVNVDTKKVQHADLVIPLAFNKWKDRVQLIFPKLYAGPILLLALAWEPELFYGQHLS